MFLVVVYNDVANSLDADDKWNVLFLKQRICQDLNLNPDVYCLSHKKSRGYELMHEDHKLLDYNLTTNCYLYLHERHPKRRYFVFCYTCESIRPALMTFSCSLCQSAFIPVCQDVDSRICRGKCSSNNCNSAEAKINFSCTFMSSHSPTVFLKHIKQNNTEIYCAACMSSEIEIIICLCEEEGHSLCLECFKKYAEEYFYSGMFHFIDNVGYTITCPAGCPNSFVMDPHHFRILGPEFYSRYKEQSVKRYLLSKGSTFCPSCGVDWQITDSRGNVKSPGIWHHCLPPVGCGSLFCSSCGWNCSQLDPECSNNVSLKCFCEEKHESSKNASSANSNSVWKSLKLRVDDAESRKYINETCRSCPGCKSPTQKHGGCNHIHCSICGLDWCWICCNTWTAECLSSHWL